MQREFEAALGRLITNRTAFKLFKYSTDEFLRAYKLDIDERDRLLSIIRELSKLHHSFIEKRKRVLQRPINRTYELLGEYGETLLNRYLDLYPPTDDYLLEREKLFEFFSEALKSGEHIDFSSLAIEVLHAELALFRAFHTNIPGEEFDKINANRPVFDVEVTEQMILTVRKGVYYRNYAYNFVNIVKQTAQDLKELKPEATSLVIYRRFEEGKNTIMRVSSTVILALSEFDGLRSVGEVAEALHRHSNLSLETTTRNLIGLAKSLCSQQVLVPSRRH